MPKFTVHADRVDRENRRFGRAIKYDFLFKSTHEHAGQDLPDREHHNTYREWLRTGGLSLRSAFPATGWCFLKSTRVD